MDTINREDRVQLYPVQDKTQAIFLNCWTSLQDIFDAKSQTLFGLLLNLSHIFEG